MEKDKISCLYLRFAKNLSCLRFKKQSVFLLEKIFSDRFVLSLKLIEKLTLFARKKSLFSYYATHPKSVIKSSR